MSSEAIIDALRNRARKFFSLDAPADADMADTAVDVGAGFVPGVGTALSARDFERARREGDALGMGLSAAGMVPVVGGVARAANKARQTEAIVDALRNSKKFDLSLVEDGNKIRDYKVGSSTVSLDARPDMVKLSSLRTPQAKRGQGSAKEAMRQLVEQADAEGVKLMLDASPLDKKTSLNRLVEFYKTFGFEPTGNRINALGDPEMLRLPRKRPE
jgi:GNAT superfamily N-acetyltransferase